MEDKKIRVQKASGEIEPFSVEKLEGSLQSSGAAVHEIEAVTADILSWAYDGISTRKIYRRAYDLLHEKKNTLASRYKLKKAIMELGPTGYPFEHFVGKLFEVMGFSVSTGIVMQGCCVTHEMDVVAIKDHEEHLAECKYSQSPGKTVSVQVPLYVRSRVNDIVQKLRESDDYTDYTFHGWVVTNTRFTSDAIAYGECSGLHMLSWDYPSGKCMKDLIDREKIYPVTVLTELTHQQKKFLLERGIVICRQLTSDPGMLEPLQLSDRQHIRLMDELHGLC